MTFYNNLILNIVLSVTASFIFWLFTFKISFTKVIFSKNLAQAKDSRINPSKSYGYRVRFANIGYRDLIELTMLIKLVIADGTRDHILIPNISSSGKQHFITFLPGKITYKKRNRSNMRTITFYPSEDMQQELSKSKYPDKIRKRAKKGKITFKDIFDEYGESVSIRVYIYGNDKTTGARKMFESQQYTMYDIKEGDFVGAKRINLPFWGRTKTQQDLISQIHKK